MSAISDPAARRDAGSSSDSSTPLRVECPTSTSVHSLRLIEGFEKWIVVGDSWVARFPKGEAAAAASGREPGS